MTRRTKIVVTALLAALAIILSLGACNEKTELDKREEAQKGKKAVTNSLEMQNLRKKIKIDENPNQLGYLYLLSFGKPFGYYVVKGKVSSAGSQLLPEDDLVWTGTTSGYVATDGPQDDGTFGQGDPGIFFFTPEGNYVTTSLDYFYSQQPVAFGEDVIDLSAKK